MGQLLSRLFTGLLGSGLFKSMGGKFFDLLKSSFSKITLFISDAFRWGSNNLKDWLSPVLKTLGFGAVGVEGVSVFVDSWKNVNEHFGFWASFFNIDSLLSQIGNVVNPRLTSVTDSTFEQIFSYCGGVHCINLFLNNAAIFIGLAIALMILNLIAFIVKTLIDVAT